MYRELYQYLIKYKELSMPGIGLFLVERKPAEFDFRNKKMNPPVYSVILQSPGNLTSKKLFNWLAEALNISNRDAVICFNDFAFDIKKQINNGDVINWNGIGSLSKGLAGEINFVASAKDLVVEKAVTAEKIIRENASHMVRVGEEEKTSAQMMEMLGQPVTKKSHWWVYALVLALLATLFVGWHFSKHGLTVSSTANGKTISHKETTATYKTLH